MGRGWPGECPRGILQGPSYRPEAGRPPLPRSPPPPIQPDEAPPGGAVPADASPYSPPAGLNPGRPRTRTRTRNGTVRSRAEWTYGILGARRAISGLCPPKGGGREARGTAGNDEGPFSPWGQSVSERTLRGKRSLPPLAAQCAAGRTPSPHPSPPFKPPLKWRLTEGRGGGSGDKGKGRRRAPNRHGLLSRTHSHPTPPPVRGVVPSALRNAPGPRGVPRGFGSTPCDRPTDEAVGRTSPGIGRGNKGRDRRRSRGATRTPTGSIPGPRGGGGQRFGVEGDRGQGRWVGGPEEEGGGLGGFLYDTPIDSSQFDSLISCFIRALKNPIKKLCA